MVKTLKIQGTTKNLYLNIPREIQKEMEIEKGETVILKVIDKYTMEIKFIEE